MEYEILSKEMEQIVTSHQGSHLTEEYPEYEIINAGTRGKARYMFWQMHLVDYGFVDGMAMIESCRLYKPDAAPGEGE